MKASVCVTGGTGGIGQALLEQLVDRYEVKALFRAKTDLSNTWTARGCTPVWGDITNDSALAELVHGTQFVFHCAAVTQGPYSQLHAVNVDGTRRLARLAATSGCQRFVYISSAAVYGAAPDESCHTEEASLCERDDMAAYSRTKLQSERALEEIARECGLDYTILRPTCVYGPGVKAFTLIPIGMITRGAPVIVGDGGGLMNVVYVDDVVNALVLAAESPQAAGHAFNIGHETVTLSDFYSCYGRMLNRPARHLPLSLINAARRLLRLIPGGGLAGLRQGLEFLARMATNTELFPSDKAKALLGYAPEVSLPVGMLKTALWGKRQQLVPNKTYFSLDTYGSGPTRFSPLCVVHPQTEDDLVQVARISQTGNLPIKAIGSLHSLCPIPETEGICIVLDQYNKLLKVEGALVTVQAGMKLQALNDALATLDLALPVLGAITQQTVSGVVSTATHGGSLHFGSISDLVESLRIVRADGSIVETNRSHHLFSGAALSIGLLGIISTITFRCVPAFVLQSRSSVKPASQVLNEFDAIHRGNGYVDMLYFPVTDQFEMLCINRPESGQPVAPENDSDHLARKPSRISDAGATRRLRTLAVKGMATLLLRNPSLHRKLTAMSLGSAYRHRTGRSDRVLAFGDGGTLGRSPLEMLIQGVEIAVPYDRAREAIAVIRNHFLQARNYSLLPIHIRCSPGSKLWLSPAYERDVCWLEFWLYPHPESLSMQQVHDLLKPFGYRFHWGKQTRADREYIQRQYERWDEFCRLRQEWDPNGVFLNSYLESFFSANPRPETLFREQGGTQH